MASPRISRLTSFGGEAGHALMKQASILGRLASFLLPGNNNREDDEAERSSHRVSGRSSGRSSGYSQPLGVHFEDLKEVPFGRPCGAEEFGQDLGPLH